VSADEEMVARLEVGVGVDRSAGVGAEDRHLRIRWIADVRDAHADVVGRDDAAWSLGHGDDPLAVPGDDGGPAHLGCDRSGEQLSGCAGNVRESLGCDAREEGEGEKETSGDSQKNARFHGGLWVEATKDTVSSS
jgi:hypothetical protein